VVDALQHLVFPVLALEEDGVAPSMSTTEPSPNLTVPRTPVSSSEKADRAPVMWLVAPVSRIHRVDSPSLLPPSWTNSLGSLRWIGEGGAAGDALEICVGKEDVVLTSAVATFSMGFSSSSAWAKWASSRNLDRHSLAQWPFLPQ
jgi:CDP-diacylglycerol pyrophosphatase